MACIAVSVSHHIVNCNVAVAGIDNTYFVVFIFYAYVYLTHENLTQRSTLIIGCL